MRDLSDKESAAIIDQTISVISRGVEAKFRRQPSKVDPKKFRPADTDLKMRTGFMSQMNQYLDKHIMIVPRF